MKRKILIFALFLFIICSIGTIFAQSGQSPAELVRRALDLAGQYENLERNTRLSPAAQVSGYSEENRDRFQENRENNLLRQVQRLEDDSFRLSTDLAYAGFNIASGGNNTWTSRQSNDLMDAMRRIDNAHSQILRNISRW
jgi:hypothetical protein